jgi:RNA polymerase sigma factor (sigma-70 family)
MAFDLSPDEGRLLVRAARDGDRAARERLFRLYSEPLRGWLRGNVGERLGRALSHSDLAQETFLRALDALKVLPDGAGLSDFEGLLYQNARWRVLKHAERHRYYEGESAAGAPASKAPDPDGDASAGVVTRTDESRWVRELIERLPSDQAAVVRRRLDGRPFADIGRELDITEETARKRHLRGTLALQRLARERGAG